MRSPSTTSGGCEEPFAPDDIANHALLTAHSPIPIATGEIEATRWGFGELVDRRAAVILQPDACVMGGVSEWWRVATLAAEESIAVIPHWHANLHAQLAAATPNCPAVEYFALSEDIYNFERLVANPLAVAEGRIVLDQTPGIGVEIDWEAVDWWAVPSPTTALRQHRTNGKGLRGTDVEARIRRPSRLGARRKRWPLARPPVHSRSRTAGWIAKTERRRRRPTARERTVGRVLQRDSRARHRDRLRTRRARMRTSPGGGSWSEDARRGRQCC